MLNKYDQRAFGWYADFDGCAYYRIVKPLEQMASNTFSTGNRLWGTDCNRFLPADWRDYDVIIGQRICHGDGNGGGPADRWVEDVTPDNDILSVYELDDDLLNVPESNPAYEFFGSPEIRNNIKLCAAKADLVTVSTEPLRLEMLKFNPNVKVLPNYIDRDVLSIPRTPNVGKVVIGWAGSPTHSADFAPMGEELGFVMGLNPNTRFMTIGGNYTHGIPIDRVRALPWIGTVRKLYKHIAKFDIGIAPLTPSRFNDSKSYIKALEYAALGIPCVASNTGPYPDFIEHGVTGFLVSKPGEWKEYVGLLANDPNLRTTMGKNARQKALGYTMQANAWRWDETLRG